MFKKAQPFFIITEASLHAGSGTDLGIVDLPIQRERHTGFPKIESSGIKGSIREVFDSYQNNSKSAEIKKFTELLAEFNELAKAEEYKHTISLAFGPEEGDAHAGALGFTDARLLLFPVKSMKGVFAWITCPLILARFKKEMEISGARGMPSIPNENTIPDGSSLTIKDNKIVLEEYAFDVQKDDKCGSLAKWLSENALPPASDNEIYQYWRDKLKTDLVVLSNDDFRDFVELSTEVIARTKIDNKTGTVAKGALFYEEYLPQDSILYCLAMSTPVFKEKESEKGIFKANGKSEEEAVMKFFTTGVPDFMQIGGNATIGKGLVRIKLAGV